MTMEIRPIRTEQDYRTALTEISQLIDKDPASGTPDGDRLDILGTLVEAYEARHYPIAPPDPIDALRLLMESRGMTVKDLVPYIGQTNRIYEILNRSRPLTLNMLYRLHDLGIPAESLLSRPRTAASKSHG
ncbi:MULTISPECIES: helix-turn-helix domain-containing protein [unclassified Delftia]|uniref:helix-turn-helix domain-containing protein n=1 Tax=unclassified Delftia TaxID=2613839 RepID=UPI001900D1C5|nr:MULTISPECIES: transcriptional regulator [unclassified Delftia]MBK0114928.1 transcriptional regulator [Delftia sp. S65]MBK0120859.1 transcriptional regulator [Delftia sp. S67]MBK0130625.1 transcriptional regulator [Delftia sp. S66]